MNENKKKKKMSSSSHDTAAEEMPSNEPKDTSKQGKKPFGRKV